MKTKYLSKLFNKQYLAKLILISLSVGGANIGLAQTSMYNDNNKDSSEAFSIIEVKEVDENKESKKEIFKGFDNLNEKRVEQSVPLSFIKNFCESNASLFEKDNREYESKEQALKYQDGETVNQYCNRYVSIMKMDMINSGYQVNNLYAQPVKQGEKVDSLIIDNSPGQNEGIVGYIKNENVQVQTVGRGTKVEGMDLNMMQNKKTEQFNKSQPQPNISLESNPVLVYNMKRRDDQVNPKASLSPNEEIVDDKTVVVNTNGKITDIEKQESQQKRNQLLLKKVIKENELIGKYLRIEQTDSGDIDMSDLIELLPNEIRSFHIRVIREGMVTTREYRLDRLNIVLDRENKIKNMSLG